MQRETSHSLGCLMSVFSKVSSEKGFVFSCMQALSFCHLSVLFTKFH